jgi:uncharacterized membrane protein YphA (DoxX/SURF4 family)
MEVGALVVGVRVAVGVLFVATGAAKLRAGPLSVIRAIGAYKLLPERWTALLGRSLGPAELSVGVMLILGVGTPAAAVAGVVLLVTFNVAIGAALRRGRRNDCGCGIAEMPISRRLIARNTALIVLLLVSATGASNLSELSRY